MSGLCGWFGDGATPAPATQLTAAIAALNRFDASAAQSASARFGAVATAAAGGGADIFQRDAQIAAVWGRLRYADAELAELAQHQGAACALLEGYARKGGAVLETLSGTFALVLLDGSREEAVLATDRVGSRPLYYAAAGERLVFGTTLDAINAIRNGPPPLNHQAVYDYVYFHMVPGPQTIYTGCHRLLPGSFLRWHKGAVEVRTYWQTRYLENETAPFPELKERFRTVLRESVREAADAGTVGTFLSGGTDSSTVAGLLGDVTGEPARTYSIGFEARGYDEMEYARIAARHFETRHHEYYVTADDVAAAIPRIAAVHDQPFGNSSAVPTYYCARLARTDGVDALLGGDGGDELFGGNERYAKQYLYSLYSDLPRVLRKGLIEPLAFLPPEIGVAGKVQRYIRNASVPMPARYDNYNLLERLGPANVFTPAFLETVNPASPPAQVEQAYHSAQAQSLINRMMALDLRYTLADNDLPKVARSCELAGIEVRFPLLNDAVMGFAARLPPGQKLRRTRLRYFFKEALRGFLPDEIIAKTKHGFGLPFGPWLETHAPLRQIALDSLADLKTRRIIRSEFLDELTSIHVQRHADYYGTMVWVLMMFEQWLRQHRVVL